MLDTIKIRQELHNYLEIADDKKIKAIYIMVEKEIAESEVAYNKTFKTELNRRYEAYQRDPSTAVSAKESKKRIQKKLNAARNK